MGCAALFHGAETLADLADIDIGSLLAESGLEEGAAEISLAGSAEAMRSEIQVGKAFSQVFGALPERDRIIARKRTFSRHPEKLATLGKEFGVSRERARQLEARMRWTISAAIAAPLETATRWLRVSVGCATSSPKFFKVLEVLVGDASPEWREAAEVVVMATSGYEVLDGVVGDESFREAVSRARALAPGLASEAGVVDEDLFRTKFGDEEAEEWEALLRNAGLVRMGSHLALRDTRRTRIFLALTELDEPADRPAIARAARLPENSSLSSVLSADPLFVRLTKDKWGLRHWTDQPYEGVVQEIKKRIRRAGGEVAVEVLLAEIPERFEVLPATVKNYLATKKFAVRDGYVRMVRKPVAQPQALEDAHDLVWTEDGVPVLRIQVTPQHLRGHSQKVSRAVAQFFGVGMDESAHVPFSHPGGVRAASVIWRSYDPTGPEMGCLREALTECGFRPGDEAYLLLEAESICVLEDGVGLLGRRPGLP